MDNGSTGRINSGWEGVIRAIGMALCALPYGPAHKRTDIQQFILLDLVRLQEMAQFYREKEQQEKYKDGKVLR